MSLWHSVIFAPLCVFLRVIKLIFDMWLEPMGQKYFFLLKHKDFRTSPRGFMPHWYFTSLILD